MKTLYSLCLESRNHALHYNEVYHHKILKPKRRRKIVERKESMVNVLYVRLCI